MSQRSLPNQASYSSLLTEKVDQICNRFEVAWKSAHAILLRPRIENYLGAVAEAECSVLQTELIHVDIYYRRLHGEDPQPADYATRFPELDPNRLADALASRTLAGSDQVLALAQGPKPFVWLKTRRRKSRAQKETCSARAIRPGAWLLHRAQREGR